MILLVNLLKVLKKLCFLPIRLSKLNKSFKIVFNCVCYASSFMKCLRAEFAHTQTECARAIAKISGRV